MKNAKNCQPNYFEEMSVQLGEFSNSEISDPFEEYSLSYFALEMLEVASKKRQYGNLAALPPEKVLE